MSPITRLKKITGVKKLYWHVAVMSKEAEEKGLWFFHESSEVGEIWYSPEGLRLKQSQGEYVWAPEHWELRSPIGYMKSLRAQVRTSSTSSILCQSDSATENHLN